MLTRAGTGISPLSGHTFPDLVEHRLQLALVNAVSKSALFCLSAYLIDGDGLGDANKTILEHAAVALNVLKAPWVMAGDWHLSQEQVAASGLLQMVDGVLFQPSSPTCHHNTFDFFVVHRSIAHAVVGVQRIDGEGVKPHHPVRLVLRGDA